MNKGTNQLFAKPNAVAASPVATTNIASHPLLVGLLLGVAVLAIYWPVLGYDFILYDDPTYFSSNPHVLGGVTWDNLAWAFRTTENSSWYPLTWLSYLLDAQLFGGGPAGPHLANLLLHAANGVLLFLLLSAG